MTAADADSAGSPRGPLTEAEMDAMREMLAQVQAYQKGFRNRAVQRKMIAEAARVLAGQDTDEPVGLIEAQTGTGKSLAYLIPAIVLARSRDLKVVIATRTVTLQQQLIDRDLPDLLAATGIDLDYRIAKGRRRYACPERIDLALSEDAQGVLFTAETTERSAAAHREVLERMQEALRDGAWQGDLDHWPDRLNPGALQAATVERHQCLGSGCPSFTRCPYFTERRRVQDATVVVANHSLLLSDVELGGGALLPEPEKTLYIIDEGHHFGDAATAHNRYDAALRTVQETLETLRRDPGAIPRAVLPDATAEGNVEKLLETSAEASEVLIRFRVVLDGHFPTHREETSEGEARWRLDGESLPGDLMAAAGALDEALRGVLRVLHRCQAALSQRLSDGAIAAEDATPLQDRIGTLSMPLEQLAGAARIYAEPDDPERAPVARWVIRYESGYHVHATPTSAAGWLRTQLWDRVVAALVTSATLAPGGQFTQTRSALGVGPEAPALRLPSPFDYERIAQFTVVRFQVDARDREAHADAVTAELPQRIDPEEGTLVLFTARRQMEQTAEALRPEWGNALICQGDAAHAEVMRRHRARIAAGEGSILFGLASFAEGVDLPGAECRHVVIVKLPFAVPDGPIEKTYEEWLKRRGRNAFAEVSVPGAAIRLMQQCGRLIRHEEDYGRITVLDDRIVTKSYGRTLMAGLPPFPRTTEPSRSGR